METDNIQFALTVAPAPTDQDKPTKVKTNNCHSITSLLDIPRHQVWQEWEQTCLCIRLKRTTDGGRNTTIARMLTIVEDVTWATRNVDVFRSALLVEVGILSRWLMYNSITWWGWLSSLWPTRELCHCGERIGQTDSLFVSGNIS